MSPSSAKTLVPGQHIATRGEHPKNSFNHVGRITKITPAAIYADFPNTSRKSRRFAFTNWDALRTLRRADPAEAEGYARATE